MVCKYCEGGRREVQCKWCVNNVREDGERYTGDGEEERHKSGSLKDSAVETSCLGRDTVQHNRFKNPTEEHDWIKNMAVPSFQKVFSKGRGEQSDGKCRKQWRDLVV